MIKRELEIFAKDLAIHRAEVTDMLLNFFMTDMLFFWGEEKGLIEQQKEVWGPLLKWAEEEFDTKFVKAKGIDVPEQDMQSGYRVRFFIENLTDKELAAFYFATKRTTSVLLAAAFVKKKISYEQAFKAASLEEAWQQSTWGQDKLIEKQQKELKQDLKEIEDFLK
ncbi:MAG: hypothetical protein LBL47_01175 [Lactobacillus sp.]|jgi:ATP synthase F1 complex assembly factor 2|nr:hypothetical protein [Lactobacillus sp.]